jgi:hypothetical protein
MSERTAPRFDVNVGDVHGGQVVIGDHNTIQTPEGTAVTVLQVGERPTPRLRPLPVRRLPRASELIGREDELALIAVSTAQAPVQLYGPDGSGKTSVLKLGATQAAPPAEGTVFEAARHRSLDEIQAGLYAAFWECDVPFVPAPSEFEGYLADREALLVLDDCGLDREDLAILLDRLPRCTLVLAATTRTLWSQGTALSLPDLDPSAAVGLLERELGRTLDAAERDAAEAVVARVGGNPQELVETAALIEDDGSSLLELASDLDLLGRRSDPARLTGSQGRVLGVLAALDRAALGTEHVAAVAGAGDASMELRDLERRGWVKSGSPRYRSIRSVPPDIGASREEVAGTLLPHLTRWAERSAPTAVAEEAEGIEGTLALGAERGHWTEVLALSLAAERGLFVSVAWSSCRRVLEAGLRATDAVADQSARAYLLHQLGSRSMCLGDRAGAEAQLTEALDIRERLGEKLGAELTRHNLEQLRGGGGSHGDGDGHGGGGGPGLPRVPIALGILAVIAIVVVAIALAGGDSDDTAKNGAPASAKSNGSKANGASSNPADTSSDTTGGGSSSSDGGSTPNPGSSSEESERKEREERESREREELEQREREELEAHEREEVEAREHEEVEQREREELEQRELEEREASKEEGPVVR